MGRLPTHYNGKRIVRRIPYTMFSECYLWQTTAGQALRLVSSFPIVDFVHDVDKPFEIHRMIPTATDLDDAVDHPIIVEYTNSTQMDYLQAADVLIRDNAKNVSLTGEAMTLANLVRGSACQTWEWEDPYYMTRGEGFIVDTAQSVFTPNVEDDHVAIRYMLAFQGFLIVLEGME